MSDYRIQILDEPDPDFSWLEQDCWKEDEDASNHVALMMLLERRCSCCGSWQVVDSLSNIDMFYWNAITGTFDDVVEIGDEYLQETARDMLAGVSA